ncbi:hypothetical protein EMIT0P201_60027 [Pseudomonas chlororaphis]
MLFPVTGFGVLRSQTAETCNTGGVSQDSFCVHFTRTPAGEFDGRFEAQHRHGIASTGPHIR